MTDPKPGNVRIIYEDDEEDSDTQQGDKNDNQNVIPGYIPIIYEDDDADNRDAQDGEQTGSESVTLPVPNEPHTRSDEIDSLSFGIDIAKDGQDDSLHNTESIDGHIEPASMTTLSPRSSEDRISDGNTIKDTSSGGSQSMPVAGIDDDAYKGPAVQAESLPVQSDETTDDPATLTFKQKLAKAKRNSLSPTPNKREAVSVERCDSVRNSKLLFEQAAAKSAEPLQKPKPTPRSAKTAQSESFQRTKQNIEKSSLGIDAILRSPSTAETLRKPKPTPRSAKTAQSESFQRTKQNIEKSSLGIDAILRSPSTGSQEMKRNSLSQTPSKREVGSDQSSDSFRRSRLIFDRAAAESVEQPATHDDKESKPAPATREINRTAKDNTIVVAAIDFGTTYSAVAFSFKNDPERIHCKTWDGQIKVPTAILLNPNQDVDSFGETAKVRFAEKFDEHNTYKDWFYFENFKMKLYQMYLDRSVKLTDRSGKEMTAMEVFAKALSYMRKELLDLLDENRDGVIISPDSDIHWVLTVPAIWPDMSKTFMRQAAEMANIPTDYLTLALEPEAASLYCRRKLGVDLRGKKYLVLDLGGGTADIVSHKIQSDDSIKECHMACGGEFGGKTVDDEFLKLLIGLYGGDVIKAFRQTKEYFEFCKAFEDAKRQFDGSQEFSLVLSPKLNEIYEKKTEQSINLSIEQSPLRGQVRWDRRGSMKINKEVMRNIFDIPLKRILEATAKAINDIGHNEATSQATNEDAGVHHILMVGGFSNSRYVVEGVKQAHPKPGFVHIPEEPSIAVIMGAVRFGHEPKAIESRMSKYTYGIGRMMTFKHGDREDYKFFANGTYWCDNCFNKHIEVGEELSTDERLEVKAHDYYPPDAGVSQFVLEVLASPERNPRYTTDDGCQSIGCMRLNIDAGGDVWSTIEVKLVYTGTELEIRAYDVRNNRLTTGKVDFLG